jgi:magnesium-transporting ATPase (P-type)
VWLGLFVGALVVVLIIYVPFLHAVFNTNDLRGMYWLLPLPLMLVVFWTDEIRKWLIRHLGTQSWIYKHTYY